MNDLAEQWPSLEDRPNGRDLFPELGVAENGLFELILQLENRIKTLEQQLKKVQIELERMQGD